MARPREFDLNSALDRAMETFRSKGYEATSLDDSCGATGLSRSSLYATFGSKRDLLLRSVDRYVELQTPHIAAILAQPIPISERIRRARPTIHRSNRRRPLTARLLSRKLCRRAAARRSRRVGASAPGPRTHRGDFSSCALSRQGAGRTRLPCRCRCTARYLTAGFQGLRLVGKVNPDRAVLEDIATTMLRCFDQRDSARDFVSVK
jgi:TetR/AcrR family transcriptional repressor of nem operon